MKWRMIKDGLPPQEVPEYPNPWGNRTYKKYVVTDGYEPRFAIFKEVGIGVWGFVNPYNHHSILDIVAWGDPSEGLPLDL